MTVLVAEAVTSTIALDVHAPGMRSSPLGRSHVRESAAVAKARGFSISLGSIGGRTKGASEEVRRRQAEVG